MRSKRLFLTFGFVATLFCLAGQVWGAKETHPKKVMVMNFKTSGCSPELGTAASVALRSVLATFDQSTYVVQERQVLNDFLFSQGLALTATLNRKASKTAARDMDVDYFIDGVLSFKSKTYTLIVQLVDAVTKATVRTYTISASSVRELLQKLPQLGLVLLDLTQTVKEDRVDPFTPPAHHLEYNSWYSDGQGVHKGGQIILEIQGETVTGMSIESYGKASMNGRIQGDRVIGVYKASYGWGNYEFIIQDHWKKLKGQYYQVSNGAKGEWSGVLK